MSVSIITPWRNHPELIADYERAVQAWSVDNAADWGRRLVDVVIVDNSDAPNSELQAMLGRLGADHWIGGPAMSFAQSNNLGARAATGDIIAFLNNDIVAPAGWLAEVRRDVKPGALYGPALTPRYVDGQPLLYVEGWCIAATRATWDQLGGWDEAYPGGYWEDNDLCFRALQLGLGLRRTNWPVRHLSNTTSKTTPGAYDHSLENYERFVGRVRAARQAVLP